MKNKMWLIVLLTLTGCGLIDYYTEVYIDGKKKIVLKSNIPSKAKIGNIEVDQRGQSWWEKIIPKNIKIEQ